MKNDIEKQAKKDFVSHYLSPLLRRADREIYSAEYEVDNNDEFVTITYANGYKKAVCITGDSLMAIVYDVIRKEV